MYVDDIKSFKIKDEASGAVVKILIQHCQFLNENN